MHNDPTDKTDPSGKAYVNVGLGLALATPFGGVSIEVGYVIAFPTPADPNVRLDGGTYVTSSTDQKGLLGSYGLSLGLSPKGDVKSMNGTAKTKTYAIGLSVTTSKPTDGTPSSVSTDAGQGGGLKMPKMGLSAEGKLKTKEGGIALGYSEGTTKTEANSLNDLMQRSDQDAKDVLKREYDRLDPYMSKK
jgi:hypothetical protein